MGLRQSMLRVLVHEAFGVRAFGRPKRNQILELDNFQLIQECYRKLGGQLEVPPLRFGSWDICAEKFIIELDEERHFNRYRLITLMS